MASPQELRTRVKRAGLQSRVWTAQRATPEFDSATGASALVRATVGAARGGDKLTTLRGFYPDAHPDVIDPENFVFTDPQTGRPTLFNPSGMDFGDVAGVGREISQAVGGTVGAAFGNVPGAAAGATGAGEAYDFAMRKLGTEDTRSVLEHGNDALLTAGLEATGQKYMPMVTAKAVNLAKNAVRGGREGQKEMRRRIAAYARNQTHPTVGQATGANTIDTIEGWLAKVPGGVGVFRDYAQKTLDAVNRSITTKAKGMAGVRTLEPEMTGRIVREGIDSTKGWMGRFRDRQGQLYGAFDKHIPGNTPMPVPATMKLLEGVAAPIPGAEALSQTALMRNPAVGELLEAFLKDAGETGAIPYEAIKMVRSRIGKKLSSFSLADDVDRATLKQLYGALSTDMESLARASGDGAYKAFRRANQYTKGGHFQIENYLEPLLKKGRTETAKIFDALNAGGKRGAQTIRGVMGAINPQEQRVVAANVIEGLGRAKPGQQNEFGDAFSLDTFLTNWNALTDPAKRALFNRTQTKMMRKDIDDIVTMAARTRENMRAFANPSGTGQVTGAHMLAGATGASVLGGLTMNPAMFSGVAIVGATIVGADSAARLMTSRRFVHWLARTAKTKPNGVGAHMGRLAGIVKAEDPETREAIMEFVETFTKLRDTKDAETQPTRSPRRPPPRQAAIQ